MNSYRKLLGVAFTVLVIAAGGAQLAFTAPEGDQGEIAAPQAAPSRVGELQEVVVGTDAAGNPSIELLGRGIASYDAFSLEDPPRLVLDLNGTVSRLEQKQYPVGGERLDRVRAGQYRREPHPVSRVVFDLQQPLAHRIIEGEDGLQVIFEQPATLVAEAAPVSPRPEPTPIRADPVAPVTVSAEGWDEPVADRAVSGDALDKLLSAPSYSSPQAGSGNTHNFSTHKIEEDAKTYTGKRISLNLVDADIKQVFRLFHEVSGLNFVLHPTVDGRLTIVLDNVPWDQALDIILQNNSLDKQMQRNVVRIAPTRQFAQEAAERTQLKVAKELEVEPVTITRTLSYAKAKEVEQVIREGGILTARGKVIVDERTNTLIVSDVPKKIDPIDQLIDNLDTETPQVMIEARIVETSREFTQDLGVVWGFDAFADAAHGTQSGLNFPRNSSVKYGLNLPGEGQASTLAFSFGNILDSFTLDLALNTLEQEGRARILSSPKIATQNNERAEIEQGVRIPVVNTTATEINVEYVSASLRLTVTPQITAEGTVILDVQVENNTPDFVNRVGDVPPINTQRAQTKVLITDGGTTVIGGIFTVNEGRSEVGVPWFRKIPVFGWLFKTRNITQENRELLIFLTPRIMRLS